jgi:hypothetical protein
MRKREMKSERRKKWRNNKTNKLVRRIRKKIILSSFILPKYLTSHKEQ